METDKKCVKAKVPEPGTQTIFSAIFSDFASHWDNASNMRQWNSNGGGGCLQNGCRQWFIFTGAGRNHALRYRHKTEWHKLDRIITRRVFKHTETQCSLKEWAILTQPHPDRTHRVICGHLHPGPHYTDKFMLSALSLLSSLSSYKS